MAMRLGGITCAATIILASACGAPPADDAEPAVGSPVSAGQAQTPITIAEAGATCNRSCFEVSSAKDVGYIAVAAVSCDGAPAKVSLHAMAGGEVGPEVDWTPVVHGQGKSCPDVPPDALKFDELSGQSWAVCVDNASSVEVIAKAGKTCKAQSFAGLCGGGAQTPSGEVLMTRVLGSGIYYLPNDVAANADGSFIHAKHPIVDDPRQGLTKFSPTGEELWRYPHGTVVATDAAGNVYAAGTFTTPTDFGTGTLPHLGGGDVFVLKLDPTGRVFWARAFGTTTSNFVDSIALDRTGTRIAISGSGSGVIVLDANGALKFSTTDFHGAVAFDSGANLIVSGGLNGTLPFPRELPPGDDQTHAFVVKLDPNGAHLWHHVFGNAATLSGQQRGTAVAVAPNDDIIVGGQAQSSIRMFGVDHELPVLHAQAGYLARISPSGEPIWARPLLFMTFLWDVASDSAGNVLVSGATEGNVYPYHITMLEKVAPDGDVLWHREQIPESSVGYGSGHGVATDRCDNVYWAVDARPDFSTFQGRSYVLKLAP